MKEPKDTKQEAQTRQENLRKETEINMEAVGNNLTAMRDEIIVQFEQETQRGNIIIPSTASRFKIIDSKPVALVLSVGPKCQLDIKQGDKVYITHNEGKKFHYQGKDYYTVRTKKPHDWVLAKKEVLTADE
jgi:co-chaperonin GroES (HSP10)